MLTSRGRKARAQKRSSVGSRATCTPRGVCTALWLHSHATPTRNPARCPRGVMMMMQVQTRSGAAQVRGFTKNRERLIEHDVVIELFNEVLAIANKNDWL